LDNHRYFAIFNTRADEASVELTPERLGVSMPEQEMVLRDLWRRKDRKMQRDGLRVLIPSHGTCLFKMNIVSTSE